jgi:hypothetical protein
MRHEATIPNIARVVGLASDIVRGSAGSILESGTTCNNTTLVATSSCLPYRDVTPVTPKTMEENESPI